MGRPKKPGSVRGGPGQHQVKGYDRDGFQVSPHNRGWGEQYEYKKKGRSTKKVNVIQQKTVKNNVNANQINTVLPGHVEGTIQIVHMTPREYLELADVGMGGINEAGIKDLFTTIGNGQPLTVSAFHIDPDTLNVVSTKGVTQAIWAYRKGIKSIPVMLVHCKKNGVFSPVFYTPTQKKKDVNYRNLIQDGPLGPSAWDQEKRREGMGYDRR